MICKPQKSLGREKTTHNVFPSVDIRNVRELNELTGAPLHIQHALYVWCVGYSY